MSKAIECPICGRDTSQLFVAPCDYRKPANSKMYSVNWCSRCDYGQVVERPSKDEVPSFYEIDEYYTHRTAAAGGPGKSRPFCDRLRTHLSWRFDKGEELTPREATSLLRGNSFSILEIGCGDGANLVKFIGDGFSEVGVEPDPVARKNAESNGIVVYPGTAEELPGEVVGSTYDVILMSHVLEHCLDINAAVFNASRILKAGGEFIVETPNCASQGFLDYKAEWPWSDIPRHLNFFTPSSLRSLVVKHGLSVTAEKYRGYSRQFSSWWLEIEEEMWRAFQGNERNSHRKPNFKLRAWQRLLKSLFVSRSKRYDSVRLIAQKVQK